VRIFCLALIGLLSSVQVAGAQSDSASQAQPPKATAQPVPAAPPGAPAPTQIKRGDRVYIQPSDFGMALTAAILKKNVPVTVVSDSTKADFWIETASKASHEGGAERVAKVLAFGGFAGSGKHFDATVTARNRDGIIVFAYNSQKGNFQSAAQNVAKNLKSNIEENQD
jgi:hypothetical protein